MRPCNNNILQLMDLATKLLFLADKGDMQREDDGCGVLFGIVRDCAYRMQQHAEKEREAHIIKGIWEERDSGEDDESRIDAA